MTIKASDYSIKSLLDLSKMPDSLKYNISYSFLNGTSYPYKEAPLISLRPVFKEILECSLTIDLDFSTLDQETAKKDFS
jgi:hypothetical protein